MSESKPRRKRKTLSREKKEHIRSLRFTTTDKDTLEAKYGTIQKALDYLAMAVRKQALAQKLKEQGDQ